MSQRIGAALACLLCVGPGCSVDVHDGMGPRVPIPNVSGRVTRAGQAADEVDVELRTLIDGEVVDSVSTASDGTFEFANVAIGDWEVKASGEDPSDFDSVTGEFHLARVDTLADLAPLDLFAYGAAPTAPPEGTALPTPNPFQPVVFRWTVPAHAYDWGRVYVYGANGEAIWFSARTGADSVLWNGLGSEGEYEGRLVSAGEYMWRLKFGFPDGQEGRTAYQTLELE